MKLLRPCLVLTGVLLVLCCVVYPALVTAVAQLTMPSQASGSLLVNNGKTVGSALLGQTFDKPGDHPDYFWGRPTAISVDKDTGVVVSGGSNYGPLNQTLHDEVVERIKALRDTGVTGDIPADLVTKSGSGLDPHISPASADIQVPRVARERRMPEAEVRQLVTEYTEGSTLGFLGEPRVNVLLLNLALDARVLPKPAPLPSPSITASAGAADAR